MSTNKSCTNCPGATDHDTAHCPLLRVEGAQGEREEFSAWWNHAAQWELRKSCAMGWGEKVWRAARAALAQPSPCIHDKMRDARKAAIDGLRSLSHEELRERAEQNAMSDVKKISPIGSIHDWEESDFGEFVRIEDYAALDSEAQALREDLQEEREISASLLGKYDELEEEANGLRAELNRINSLANCGSVQNWLKLSDEDKAKWFELYCRKDDENVGLRRETAILRQHKTDYMEAAEGTRRALMAEIAALRARVVAVVPERRHVPICAVSTSDYNQGMRHIGWNACLDELARLNGKAVSEGLLRRLCPIKGSDGWTTWHSKDAYEAAKELAAVLDGEQT